MKSGRDYRGMFSSTFVVLALAGVVVASASVAGAAMRRQSNAVVQTTPGAEPAQALSAAFRGEIQSLPNSATSEDLEASLVFVLSQNVVGDDVAIAALDGLAIAAADRPALRLAVINVRSSILNRRFKRGTAALSSNDLNAQTGFTSTLTVLGGGGTSNYVQ